jgi:hypothetical protein
MSFIIIKHFFSNHLKISNSMKNVVKVFAFMSLVLAFSCTKDNSVTTDTTTVDDIKSNAINEITALTTNGADTTKGGDGMHGCGNKGGFGNMGKGHHEHPEGVKGDSIAFKDLPAAAQKTLTDSGFVTKILRILKTTEADGTIRYVVRFTDKKHIHFDAAGAIITLPSRQHSFTAITIDDLPAAAKAHLLANTDASKVTHVIKVTKPDGSIVYGVRTSDNKEFRYDANGVLLPNPERKKKH